MLYADSHRECLHPAVAMVESIWFSSIPAARAYYVDTHPGNLLSKSWKCSLVIWYTPDPQRWIEKREMLNCLYALQYMNKCELLLVT